MLCIDGKIPIFVLAPGSDLIFPLVLAAVNVMLASRVWGMLNESLCITSERSAWSGAMVPVLLSYASGFLKAAVSLVL